MDIVSELTKTPPSVEALYRADSPRLWRAVYAWAGDAEVASDAVAEAYAQVLRRGGAVRDPAAWTWRTAFKIAAGALKDRPVSRDAELDPDTDAHLDAYTDPDLLAALRRRRGGPTADAG